jgi:hypothetical protein
MTTFKKDWYMSKSRNELRKERKISKMKALPKLKMSNTGILDIDQVVSVLFMQYRKELTSLKFDMEAKAHRYNHLIHHISEVYKPALLAKAGLRYSYNIRCCVPTLLYQLAMMCNGALSFKFIQQYLESPDEIREHLSRTAGISIKQAIMVVNALFCGARLGRNPRFALSRDLDYDYAKIEILMNDKFLTGLQEDIKRCWAVLDADGHVPKDHRVSNKKGHSGAEGLHAISTTAKWELYTFLEKLVLDAVIRYLDSTGNGRFTEHNEWTTQNKVDVDGLIAYVFNETGFSIKLTEKEYTRIAAPDADDILMIFNKWRPAKTL